MTPYQLERIEKVLVAVRRLKDYLDRGKQYENPLAYYEENLDAVETLREEICRQIRNGAVDDYASKELKQIRGDIVRCQEQMKQKAEQLMRTNKEYMADSYCTTRNGRICVPVKKEYKFKISGTVVDKSATGNTFFIEPVSVAKYYEELQLLCISEENEVYRILYTLTAMVAESISQMNENIRIIEKAGFYFFPKENAPKGYYNYKHLYTKCKGTRDHKRNTNVTGQYSAEFPPSLILVEAISGLTRI